MKISLFRISGLVSLLLLCIWFLIARPFSFSQHGVSHEINSNRLKEEVRIISEDFQPRNSENPAQLNKLSAWLLEQFQLSTPLVEFQHFQAGESLYRNVIAKFGPDTKKVIVIGAHYDAFSDLPAADDNASGVVGLLELSRLLKDQNLAIQVQLVAFTLEEPPWFASDKMGSFIHARSLKTSGTKVELMISLEMIGFFSEEANSQSYPVPLLSLMYPSKGNFIAVVDELYSNNAFHVKSAINRSSNIAAYSINAPRYITGIDFSDHRNYWTFGFPAVMVTNTAFYRNHTYHTPHDTYDKLNYAKMAEVILGVYSFIKTYKSDI